MTSPASTPRHVRHLVVGAGFGGLGAAITLAEDGEDFLVVDKGTEVGGTWRDNTYPGAACDVPSPLYSFSFAPNPDWSMSFSPQPEIQAYLRRVAVDHAVLDRFRFGTAVEHAAWDDDAQQWRVRLSDGSEVTSTTLITASGGLSEPRLPDIDGIDGFQGEIFHSARWNHDVDLTGKRVAVVGTGASAIQIVPEVRKVAAHLDVYQRTAPYVIPRNDRTYTRLERLAFQRLPLVQKAYRTAIYWGRESYVPGFTRHPKLAWPAKQLALVNIRKGIVDPELRERVTPDFEIGCKRILISNTYYPALASANVDLVTDRPIAQHVVGREGRSLAEVWSEAGMAAYKGTTVHGFPNLFQVVGPNTGLGHSSMVFVIESQLAYIRDAIRTMRVNDYATVEPRRDVQDAWNADLQERMERTVWNRGGCASWYLDEHGRNTVLWPRSTFTMRRQLSRFDPAAYVVTAARPTTTSAREDVHA